MRLNKFIALSGEISGRGADELIGVGRVRINGTPGTIGTDVDPERDRVEVDGRRITPQKVHYLALYKPKNVITSLHDPQGRPCVRDYIPGRYRGVVPVGRLDFDAQGLLLLTNDGDLAHAVHHPAFDVPKVYEVRLVPRARAQALHAMAEGVLLDGKKTRPARIERLRDEAHATVVRIVLRQGLKNQIKRMAASVGLNVTDITRIAVGPISFDGMKPGEIRELSAVELSGLHKMLKRQKKT